MDDTQIVFGRFGKGNRVHTFSSLLQEEPRYCDWFVKNSGRIYCTKNMDEFLIYLGKPENIERLKNSLRR